MFQPLQTRCYGFGERTKLYNVAKDNVDFVQRLKLRSKLEVHTGCVNTICWNDTGTQILSGSDDQHLVFTDPFKDKKILSIRSGHRANIFSAKYLPNTGDKQVVSCSGDGKIYYTDVERTDNLEANLFDCHFGTTYEVIVIPSESATFLSCGEDGTVRWFDMRVKSSCFKEDCKEDVLINCRRAVTSLAVNPVLPYQLGIACSDSSVRIFDRRMLGTRASGNYTGRGINGMLSRFTAPTVANRSYRITSLNYSPNGNDVLVSYSSEYIYLFGTKDNQVKQLETKVTGNPKKSNGLKQSSEPPKVKKTPPSQKTPPKQEETKMEESTSTKVTHSDPKPVLEQTKPEVSESVSTQSVRPKTLVSPEPQPSTSEPKPSTSEPQPSTSEPKDTQESGSESAAGRSESAAGPSVLAAGPSKSTAEPSGSVAGPSGSVAGPSGSVAGPSGSAAGPSGSAAGPSGSAAGSTGTLPSPDSRQPPVKRLRLRGDWSDTGPNARPESERQSDENVEERRNPHTSLMQRMSDMLTRWLDGNLLRGNEGGDRGTAGGSSAEEPPPEPVLPQDSSVGENQEPVALTVDSTSHGQSSASNHGENVDQTSSINNSVISPEGVDSNTTPVRGDEQKSDLEAAGNIPSSSVLSDSDNTALCGEVVSPAEYNLSSTSNTRDTVTSHSDAHSLSVQQSDDSLDNSPNSSLHTQDSVLENHDEISSSSFSGAGALPGSLSPCLSESQSPESESLSQLEPVISLHYSTQGTSSSTVRLGFAKFENLEAGILQRSAENATLEPFARETTHQLQQQEQSLSEEAGLRVEHPEEASPSMDMEESIESPISNEDNMCIEMNDSSESNNDSEICKVIEPEDNSMDTDTLCSDTVSSSSAITTAQSETEKSSSSNSKSKIPILIKKQAVPDSDINVEKKGESSCVSGDVEKGIEDEKSMNVDDVSEDSEMPSSSNVDSNTETNQASTESGERQASENIENDQSAGSARSEPDGASSSANGTDLTAGRNSSQPSTEGTSTGARQRRIGRSGPPTGNFQLSLNEDSSDNETEGNPRRNRDSHSTLERHVNAIRLQELYRKRQEEKEKEEMEMKNIHQPGVSMKYKGHRNARTMIKEANFWGDNFVMSGSDCGHIFIWDRFTSKLVMLLEADKHVVNCLQPHPFDPILASSGIDYDVKIWEPLEEQPCFDSEAAEEIVRRNEVMLEETRDTITVPAAFMLRVLASLNQIRAGRATSNRENNEENDSSSDSE